MKKPIVINVPSLIVLLLSLSVYLYQCHQSKQIEKELNQIHPSAPIQKSGHKDLDSLIELYNNLKKTQDEMNSRHFQDSVRSIQKNSRIV